MVGMCDYKIATRYTALNDYIPIAPTDDEARKHNENLPGMGGAFNVVNLQLYHYAGIGQRSDSELQANNPVKYVDLDGNSGEVAQIWQESQGAGQLALVAFLRCPCDWSCSKSRS